MSRQEKQHSSEFPRIALCVATIARVEELDRLLCSLGKQEYTNFHVYIGDQNPPGVLDELLVRHAGLPLTHVRLPAQGVSRARNVLLSHVSDADIIAFPDDDCWYVPETLEQVVAAFARHPDGGGLLGCKGNDSSTAQDAPVSRLGTFFNGETYLQFFRAAAIKEVRFDPQLGPGTGLPYGNGEDTDFLLEVHRKTPLWRCPAIRVFHPSPETALPSDAKIAAYAAGRMYLLKKHAFPLWFRWSNVVYPLCMLPLEMFRFGCRMRHYRWRMFIERWRNF